MGNKEFEIFKGIRSPRRLFRGLRYFMYFIIASAVIVLIVAVSYSFAAWRIYQSAFTGQSRLQSALASLEELKCTEAKQNARSAESYFASAYDEINSATQKGLGGKFPFIRYEGQDVGHLFFTAKLLSRAVADGSAVCEKVMSIFESGGSGTKFSDLSKEKKGQVIRTIYEAGPEMSGMRANLDLAVMNLEKIRYYGLLSPLNSRISILREKTALASQVIGSAEGLVNVLPKLLGYPKESAYLILLQNSDELRPTGGFIGTYGIAKVEYADFTALETHDVYHLDMPVRDLVKTVPPEPIQKYLGLKKWYFRDANWSPDWPTAAKHIVSAFESENKMLPEKNKINSHGGPFDGVIGLTPRFVTDLLWLAGPITIDGTRYDKDNFVQLLEYKVEKGFEQEGVPRWERKEVIGDLMRELKQRLFAMELRDWPRLADLIRRNIVRKDMILYFSDPSLQALAQDSEALGEVIKTDGDYVYVVDANMGALKTDAVMRRDYSYEVEQGKDGLIGRLHLNYINNGREDWRTTAYKSYTRVYLPAGAKLVKATGIDKKNIDKTEEFGKSAIGFYLTVATGGSRTITLEYSLPDRLAKNGQYSLYFQKQPGNKVASLRVDVGLSEAVSSYSPQDSGSKNGNYVHWETDLESDKKFEIKQ